MVGKLMKETSPYDLHAHGGGGFVCFEVDDTVALPLLSLGRASLRIRGPAEQLTLTFEDALVTIDGSGLRSLMEHLLAGQVKAIRPGRFEACCVEHLHLVDA